ncbi:MAG: archaeal flagellin FlaB [Methanomicrobiaceae archaeon]|nr:archaeal flagellin FlaB [Methanomicrobiaceae archaeon]
MRQRDRNDRAFTGLETAIVLIAIVVVASVFAYAVIGAGMAASQKSQQTMYTALGEAASGLRTGDSVIVKLDNDRGYVRFVEFDLETVTDIAAIDPGRLRYTIATEETVVTIPPGDPRAGITWRYRRDDGGLLEAGEVIAVRLNAADAAIGRGDAFSIEITAADGAIVSLSRRVPAGADKNVYLELF